MIISTVQNRAVFRSKSLEWIQRRPRITQIFGVNPEMYKKFGMDGHNGVDIGVPIGTPLFAPMDGVVKVKDSKDEGYGLHVRIRNSYKKLEFVVGHMSKVAVKTGGKVVQGQFIGFSGNSGFSTGPHVHEGLRSLKAASGDIWLWRVENYHNGFYGYWDHAPYAITYKGTYTNNNLTQ